MNILWILDIEPEYGPRHGGTLRYTQLSKGLMALGHRVYYIVINRQRHRQLKRNEYLEILRNEDCFTDCVEMAPVSVPPIPRKLSRLALHPGVQKWILARYQVEFENQISKQLDRWGGVDVSIVSQRSCLFLLSLLSGVSTTIVDWCDSEALFEIREIPHLAKMGKFAELPGNLKQLVFALVDETYYGRRSDANIVVSSGDKEVLDRLNRRPFANRLLQNGVELFADNGSKTVKDPNRLIFSGTMDFSPNYDGALWFIQRVMPLLVKNRQDIRLVVAGQKPISRLLESATGNVQVIGFVPDLRAEIQRSQLYVAPLISGSGFRNKVVEAIASGTYVIGTPMALECLDDKLRQTLLTARTAEDFAMQIDEYLADPLAFDQRLNEAMHIVREDYKWATRIREFEELLCATTAGIARSNA